MADVFTKEVRSRVMSAIRSKGNKETELRLAKILQRAGLAGWRRHQLLPGRPDFLFPKARLALFIDGCFWHGCPRHGQTPASNEAYWLPKLLANRTRDRRVDRELRALGWKVIRVWEHELNTEGRLVKRLERALRSARPNNITFPATVCTQAPSCRPKEAAQHFRSARKR